MKQKEFKSAPLPFQGQKRNFIKHFKRALKDFPSDATYVDLFGGSGLLSHTVKCVHPEAKVIYNDFDNFQKRLKAIPETNKILEELRALNLKTPRNKLLKNEEKEKVLEVLKRADKRGYVDWILLSGNLKFSMSYGLKFEDFVNDSLYNKIRISNFDEANDYLAGIEVVSEDYRHLFQKYKDFDNVVFLADPPYLSTDAATYASDKYWKLTDYLEVLETLQGLSFFYFTSNKSQVVELCQWIGTRTHENLNPFKYATCAVVSNNPTNTASYQDIMYHYKKREKVKFE